MLLEIKDYSVDKREYNKNIIFWTSTNKCHSSLDYLLEDNKHIIKKKFLEINKKFYENNQKKFSNFKYLDISLLEISLVLEKNPFKSPKIYDCLKLLALEILIDKKEIKKVLYLGNSSDIYLSLKEFCNNKKVEFDSKIKFYNKESFIFPLFYSLFFYFFFILKNFKKTKVKNFDSKITFFSYFVHFNNTKEKKYNSLLWGGINNLLKKMRISSNWFHFFVPSNQVQNINIGKKKINLFNRNYLEKHGFINVFISYKDLIYIFLQYLKFFTINIFIIKNKKDIFLNSISKTNFYYFMKKDFDRSFFGDVMIYNLLNILSIDQILKKIPKQKIGFYLIENQGWELCLIKLWRKYNHSRLVGCINSTIRFWDLRYFKNKEQFHNNENNPDFYFFNSKYFRNIAIKNYYPDFKCKLVEAVRYNHLIEKKNIKKNKDSKNKKKILLVGDINFNENYILLEEIYKVKDQLNNSNFFFKPHPTNSVKLINDLAMKYKKIKFLNCNKYINFSNFDTIICANGTSAILDCLILNLKCCSVKIFGVLDLFPLSGRFKKYQITNIKKLLIFIRNNKIKKFKEKFFYLDKRLRNWQNFIIKNNT
jgi:surface carbohydrate biosynthesis protein (TIGR04326 family)